MTKIGEALTKYELIHLAILPHTLGTLNLLKTQEVN